MKDWLNELLKIKSQTQTTSAESSVSFVVEAFGPFLKALAQVSVVSVERVVSDALFQHLSDKADVIAESQTLAPLGVDTSDFVSPKSGLLDKASDDCLKVALSYLSISDRCAAEHSCKRLFHLSRALPIKAKFHWNYALRILAKRSIDEKSVMRIASRFWPVAGSDAPDNWFNSEGLLIAAVNEKLPKAINRHFRNTVSRVAVACTDMFEETDFIQHLYFPKLKHVTFGTIDLDSARMLPSFLRMHSALLSSVCWQWTLPLDTTVATECLRQLAAVIFQCLSRMSALRTVRLVVSGMTLPFSAPTDCDFQHIDTVILTVDSRRPLSLESVKPVLHRRVRTLQLEGCIECCRVQLPCVSRLRLGGRSADISKLTNWHYVLAGLSPAAMQRISSRGTVHAFSQLFPETTRFAAELHFEITDSFDNASHVKDAVDKLKRTLDCGSEVALSQLTFVMANCPRQCPPHFHEFLACLSRFVDALPPLCLKLRAQWWNTAVSQIPQSAAEALAKCQLYLSAF